MGLHRHRSLSGARGSESPHAAPEGRHCAGLRGARAVAPPPLVRHRRPGSRRDPGRRRRPLSATFESTERSPRPRTTSPGRRTTAPSARRRTPTARRSPAADDPAKAASAAGTRSDVELVSGAPCPRQRRRRRRHHADALLPGSLALAGNRRSFRAGSPEGDLPGGVRPNRSARKPHGRALRQNLVGRGILGPPARAGHSTLLPLQRQGDTLVCLSGSLRPLDVFRLLSEQVRPNRRNLDRRTFAILSRRHQSAGQPRWDSILRDLGAGISISPPICSNSVLRRCGLSRGSPALRGTTPPEAFKIGPTPREFWRCSTGANLADLVGSIRRSEERLTFLRALYLLVETDLAELDS